MFNYKINYHKLETAQTLRFRTQMKIRMSLNFTKEKRTKVFNQITDIRVQERQFNKLIK